MAGFLTDKKILTGNSYRTQNAFGT